MSRPFCAPGAICVEFVYQMFGIGNGTTFSLLLSSPAGTLPKSIWDRVGSQKPEWQNASVTIPPGLPQPMQVGDDKMVGCDQNIVGIMEDAEIIILTE